MFPAAHTAAASDDAEHNGQACTGCMSLAQRPLQRAVCWQAVFHVLWGAPAATSGECCTYATQSDNCVHLHLQGIAVWQLIAGVDFFSPLTISLLWAIYNAIPPFLILWYSVVGRVSDVVWNGTCCYTLPPAVPACIRHYY